MRRVLGIAVISLVLAFLTGGCGDSGFLSVSGITEEVRVPSGLRIGKATYTTVELSWTAADDDDLTSKGFKLYRDGKFVLATYDAEAVDTGLFPGTEYCYNLTAYGPSGRETPMGDTVCASTKADETPPTAPTGLTATATGAREVKLRWTASTDNVEVAEYRIFRDGKETGVSEKIPARDSGLSPVTAYCYKVAAVDIAGNVSEKSAQACATTPWDIKAIDTAGNTGIDTDIAVDSAGRAHISYYSQTGNELRYATNKGGSWRTSVLDNAITVTTAPIITGIALDDDKNIHISYVDGGANELKYATDFSGSWAANTVDATRTVDNATSLVLDSAGDAWITYHDTGSNDLWLGFYSASIGSQSYINAASLDDSGKFSSLVIDSSDVLHMCYYREDLLAQGFLEYASYTGTVWTYDTIDASGMVLDQCSMAQDAGGNFHVSYHYYDPTPNPDDGFLMYATGASGAWTTETVDSTTYRGEFNSMAVAQDGTVHISYYDKTNGNLMRAYGTSGSWTAEVIDSSGDVGKYNSIILDSDGYVHISYYDATNGDLKYATNAP